ncbi:PRC-barrel domain-containing protein [Microvirga lenta]|uniref:PRC-barrel domain-containing protein n=1 Tax=Microvirga lenta TaxID=2881337 RepID=UPI001CFF8DBD|nr:PRC-barrel domain-containing protein [Microvirga lenta]MCB5176393.1 PRC-barrel domain-containing protein [Microvirga lenta]
MLKTHMAACLVATMFVAAPALAQTSTTPSGATDRPVAAGSGSTATGSPAMQPNTANQANPAAGGMSSPNTSAMNQGGGAQGQFMTQMQPNQIMASKLIGTRVVSSNNESIGDINDVIVDRNGQAVAAVVGVGGFLGIGEKDVAVPFDSLEFASRDQVNAMSGNNAGGNNAGGNVTTTGSTAGTATGTTGTTGAGGAMSGNTNTAGASNTTAGSGGNTNEPERVVLRMTKAELQAAPAFNTSGNNNDNNASGAGGASGTGTTGTTGAGGTTAPQQ